MINLWYVPRHRPDGEDAVAISRWIACILVAAVLLPAVAFGQSSELQELVANAEELIKQKQYDDAIPAISDAIEQARVFLNSLNGNRLEALYSVAIAVGLRNGEALALRWDDIDLDKGALAVRWSLQRIDGKLILVEPKSK